MPNTYRVAIAHRVVDFFKIRDDLRLRNIRWELWALLLVFPLPVIMGNLRYFDLKMTIAGFGSWDLMLFMLGLGWLITAFTPKRLLLPLLRVAAVLSTALLPLRIFMPNGLYRLPVFMAFQFLSGICAAAAFYLFCFELNNIERLFGMVIIQFYYGFFYIVWLMFPEAQAVGETWCDAAAMAACLIVVFASSKRSLGDNSPKHNGLTETTVDSSTPDEARLTGAQASPTSLATPTKLASQGVALAIGLDVVYYVIICMTNRIKWTENNLSSAVFGIGSLASIILIIIIQVLFNRSALHIWFLFLVLSLSALGVLMYKSPEARLPGSFAYGLGDGLGYVIIYYLCAGAIKKSASLKMWRLYCLVSFVKYFAISGIFSLIFDRFQLVGDGSPDRYLAFGVMLFLCSVCFLLMPLMRKKLFEKDWTDGIQLQDIAGYAGLLAETEAINTKDHLNLTDREHEVFILLLKNLSPKEIAHTLKISYNTVVFHRQNLYRKLGIQSRAELLTLYLPSKGKR